MLKEYANHIDRCSNVDSNLYHHFFLSDEEVGGAKGMNLFVQMEYFKKLNVGFALDEGMIYVFNLPIFVVYIVCVSVSVCVRACVRACVCVCVFACQVLVKAHTSLQV